jgi:hypothetical protein
MTSQEDTMQATQRRARRLLVAGAIAAGVMVPSAAVAQEYPTPTDPPSVTADPGAGSSSSVTDPGGTRLPVTGGQVAGLTLIGLGAAGAGAVLVRIGRRPVRAEIDL